MKSLLLSSMLMSITLIFSSHPMALIAIISLQALIISATISLATHSSWFSFILFLVFMGGLMVLFIYVSSLASNEKFNLSLPFKLNSTLSLLTASGFMMLLTFITNNQMKKNFFLHAQTLIFKMYLTSSMTIIAFTMTFLLLALIIIVNTTMLKQGPLRQLN